jgi:LysM repeat protein
MSEARQAITGILAALVSAVIIFGSIILALTETGQRVARLPETLPTLDTPMPPVDTPAPGEPTFTASPTHIPQTPALEATFSCAMRPGWQPLTVLAGDTWESLALEHSTDLSTFLAGNCQDEEKYKNNRLQSGMVIYVPKSQASPTLSPTASPTSSATATIQAEPASGKPKTGQNKPKPTPCGPPASWVRYTVRSGDNLTRIALATGTTVARLRNANCLNTTLIRTGQRLWVPRIPVIFTPTLRPTRTPTRTLAPPTTVPTNTPAPTEPPPPTNTERPTTEPLPSDTPVPSEPPPPTAYP